MPFFTAEGRPKAKRNALRLTGLEQEQRVLQKFGP